MKKSIAKQCAAFDACLLLRKHKLLDDHFNSIYHRRLPAMRNAKLAITSKHTNEYEMISKPSFWDIPEGALPTKLYAVLISFKPSEPLSREHGDIIQLTREKLPEFPSFSIFLDENVETNISSTTVLDVLEVSNEELDCLTDFTLRVFRDVFHKVYTKEPEKIPYWFAPAVRSTELDRSSPPRGLIDWETLCFVQQNEEIQFSTDIDPNSFVNRLVYDPWDGRFRLFTGEVDDTLRPSDPPPDWVHRRRHMDNIMSYCVSLSKNSRAKFFAKANWDQPVFHAELVRLRRNLLDKMVDQEREVETRSVVCLEALRISAVCFPSLAIINISADITQDSDLTCYFIPRLPGDN